MGWLLLLRRMRMAVQAYLHRLFMQFRPTQAIITMVTGMAIITAMTGTRRGTHRSTTAQTIRSPLIRTMAFRPAINRKMGQNTMPSMSMGFRRSRSSARLP